MEYNGHEMEDLPEDVDGDSHEHNEDTTDADHGEHPVVHDLAICTETEFYFLHSGNNGCKTVIE